MLGGCANICMGAGQTLCMTGCRNLQTDPTNCGACGFSCGPGQTCVSGACVGTMCPTGQTSCGGTCTTTLDRSRELRVVRAGLRGGSELRRRHVRRRRLSAGTDRLRLGLHEHQHRPAELRRLRRDVPARSELRGGRVRDTVSASVGHVRHGLHQHGVGPEQLRYVRQRVRRREQLHRRGRARRS